MKNNSEEEEKYKKFNCKICFELATQPVITPCGHLYCWQCLYKWAETKNPLTCPYCSNVFDFDKIVTVFAEGEQENKNKDIPKRPKNPHTPQQRQQQQQQQQNNNFQFHFGVGFPFMMFQFQPGQQQGYSMLIIFLAFFIFQIFGNHLINRTLNQISSFDSINFLTLLIIIFGFIGLNKLIRSLQQNR